MHVLFVCNGNVCRSPIAERLTRAFAAELDWTDLTAESAGIRALAGFPIEPMTAQVIAGLGGDPTGFTARKLKPSMIDRADIILTMTSAISKTVIGMGNGIATRTFTLLEAYRIARVTGNTTIAQLNAARDELTLVGKEDIADPTSLSEVAYTQVGDRISDALVPLLFALNPGKPVADNDTEEKTVTSTKEENAKVLVFRRPEVRKRTSPAAFATATTVDMWQQGG